MFFRRPIVEWDPYGPDPDPQNYRRQDGASRGIMLWILSVQEVLYDYYSLRHIVSADLPYITEWY